MSKSSIAVLLALAVTVSVTGCGKQQSAPTANSPATPAAGMPVAPHHMTASAPSEDVDLSGIARADGGKTIAEVFAEKDQLAGQVIVFRGKLVKANANIMGKNWLHVRDGSGAEGTNDLTVTTIDVLPNVGDTLLVTGLLEVNKDFGMGYRYDVIIENAEVKVETAAPKY